MTTTTEADVFALADRLVAAIEAADIDGVRSCYAPQARIWHNFDQVEQSVDENLRVLKWMAKRMVERRYDIVRRVALADGYLQEHVLRGTTASGAKIEMPACLVVTVDAGRITGLREYLDPAHAAALETS